MDGQVDIDEGHRHGLATTEREELVRLRRKNRVLKMECELPSQDRVGVAGDQSCQPGRRHL